uniref:Uncharacterized protein n=1 Tax=Arundo donax TaxID=35708 RepID=A0A0A9GDC4_ARUDO
MVLAQFRLYNRRVGVPGSLLEDPWGGRGVSSSLLEGIPLSVDTLFLVPF